MVEQRIRNAWVGGSSPLSGTNDINDLRRTGLPGGSQPEVNAFMKEMTQRGATGLSGFAAI